MIYTKTLKTAKPLIKSRNFLSILRIFSVLVLITPFRLQSYSQTTYYTAQTGLWNNGTTWAGGTTPGDNDNAIIQNGHQVILTTTGQGTFINDLNIESGGILNAGVRKMTINGKFIIDGTYTSSFVFGQDLDFFGDTLGGTGSIVINSNKSIIIGADVEIIAGSQLTVAGHVSIDNAVTVTNFGELSATGDIDGQNNSSSVWTNETGSIVEAGDIFMNTGILNASATGNTVIYAAQADQDIKTPNGNTYYNLTITGSDTKTQSDNLTINNTFTISAGVLDCDNNDLDIKGDWINNSDFTEGTGTVTFSGTADQSITSSSGELFYNLTINKSTGSLILNDAVSVSNTLDMTSGVIETSLGSLTLGISTAIAGTLSYTGGYVFGDFERWIDLAGSYLFPIGKTAYQSLNITINGLVSGGTLNAEFFETDPGSSGLPLFDNPDSIFNSFVDGYWDLSRANGFNLGGANTYDISLDGTGFTSFTINPTTRVLLRPDAGSNWIVEG
ncbi:MAG: hypothetical protein AMS23_11495, partial [Bacteroides sp. SM1_62]